MSRQFTVVWRLIYGYTNYTHPTGNLDSRTSQDVLGLLKVTGERFGQTMVMITHNEEIAQMADRIIRIEDGRIRADSAGGAEKSIQKGGDCHA